MVKAYRKTQSSVLVKWLLRFLSHFSDIILIFCKVALHGYLYLNINFNISSL